MVYRLQITFDEIVDIWNVKHIAGSSIGYTLPPGVYKISDIILVLKSLLPTKFEEKITLDDIRLKSILRTDETIRFPKRIFLYIILGFTQSHSGELGDFPGSVQLITGSYKSDKSINFTGIDNVHLKCNCFSGSFLKRVRQAFWNSFALSSPPGLKKFEEPRIKLFKKINKPLLSHKKFYLEGYDHNALNFNGKTISFNCQLVKI